MGHLYFGEMGHFNFATTPDGLESYRKGEQREEHVTKIRKRYGYGDITEGC